MTMMDLQETLERQLLAELMTDSKAYYLVAPILHNIGRNAWTCPNRVAMFTAIEKATADGREPDMMAVSEALSELGMLETVGGLKAVGEAAGFAISSAHVEQHAHQLVDAYMARQLGKIGERIMMGTGEGCKSGEIGTAAMREIQELLDCRTSSRIAHVKALVSEAMSTFRQAEAQKGAPTGILSGLSVLDEVTGGWQAGDYIILAARPSTGKTNVALSWVIEAAKQCPVLFYSAEMSGLTITQRMIGVRSNINDRRIKRAMLAAGEIDRMVDAARSLSEREIYLNDAAAPLISDIESEVRKMVREKKIGLVVIDYIGKIRTKARRSRQEEVADVSSRLKAIAMEHRVPVITLAQLNRNIESRSGLPVLSDLREAGDLEQDADTVIFLHSFARTGVDEIPKGFGKYSGRPSAGLLCFVVAKQRTGPISYEFARFVPETGRITPADDVLVSSPSIETHHAMEPMPF
jgi:replicative DNA helicase